MTTCYVCVQGGAAEVCLILQRLGHIDLLLWRSSYQLSMSQPMQAAHVHVMAALLTAQANADMTDTFGRTALQMVCSRPDASVSCVLLALL